MGSLKTEEDLKVSNEAILYVNGVRRLLSDGLAHFTLLEYLRGIPFSFQFMLNTISLGKACIPLTGLTCMLFFRIC